MNTNAPNPWYEQSAVVYYHWLQVGIASECAEQALSERQPALLQSSDRPRSGLYGAQKWPLTAQLVEKSAQGWSMYLFCLFGWSSGPSRVDTGRVRSFACLRRPFTRKGPHFLSLGLVVAPVRLEYWGKLH